jgi:hypothetical protein
MARSTEGLDKRKGAQCVVSCVPPCRDVAFAYLHAYGFGTHSTQWLRLFRPMRMGSVP